MPTVDGSDLGTNRATGDVAGDHNLPMFSYKRQFTEKFSLTLMYDHDFGASISYDDYGDETVPSIPAMFAGTFADVKSEGYSAIARYKFDDNWSVHGGVRASEAKARLGLSGAAYGSFSGYQAKLDSDMGYGFIIGGAYERPDIAARFAVTYFSKIKHKFDTTETLNGIPGELVLASLGLSADLGKTDVDTPQSVNIDFQTGIMEDTLLFGSVRWANWSKFKVDPPAFHAVGATQGVSGGLVDLDDSWTYTLGIGRRFTENWSGSAFLTYEPKGEKLVSPLAPTNGYKGIGVAAVYTRDNVKVTAGIRYLDIGDAKAETGMPDTARSRFENNHAVAAGIKVGFSF